MRRALLVVALLIASLNAFSQESKTGGSQPAAAVTAIKAGKLVDVDAGQVRSNQTIVIRGNKIEAVGSNVAAPAGAKVLDFSQRTVLPGLIDCHTHLVGNANEPDPVTELTKTSAQ